jgi:hypothetical protein
MLARVVFPSGDQRRDLREHLPQYRGSAMWNVTYSVAELSCQKIIFDLQLADLPIQKIDLRFIGGSLRRRAALEDAHRTVQQLLLPVVDLVPAPTRATPAWFLRRAA